MKPLHLVTSRDDPAHYECPHCGDVVAHGYTVCRGCHAEVVYGSTRQEWRWHFARGLLIGSALVVIIGWYVSELLLWSPLMTRVMIFQVIVLGLLSGYCMASHGDAKRRQEPPRFLRFSRL